MHSFAYPVSYRLNQGVNDFVNRFNARQWGESVIGMGAYDTFRTIEGRLRQASDNFTPIEV